MFAAVNAFLVAIWVLTNGSLTQLKSIVDDPTKAISASFWPIWPILGWGTLIVIHGGFAIPDMLLGGRARRRRREMAKHAARAGKDIAGEVSGALDRAHERRMERDARRARRSEGFDGPGPQRRWVTVLFSDIADSTKHNEVMGDEEWHAVLARVRSTVRTALAARGGSEVGTQGDGMLARFESPADAVLCGIDIQSELATARTEGVFIPEVRIGVHAGEAVHDDGDLVGRVINLASRVTDEANPGEILVTEPVADQLVGKLELEDKGLRPLKGVSQPRHLLAVKWSSEVQT